MSPSGRAATTAQPVYIVEDLTKTYNMGEVAVHALRGVNLTFYSGEFAVLLGPSGSGKSTLLNILGGLDVPSDGRVAYRGKNLALAEDRIRTNFRRRHVGFVFQFYNLISSLTARENVALVTDIAENPLPVEDALKLVKLEHRMDHFPSQLSGGEQQRVAIARAIAKQPDILLCDEPTGALDIQTGIVVMDVLASINRDIGTTTVVISHNRAIAGMADRSFFIADGQIERVEENPDKLEPSQLQW